MTKVKEIMKNHKKKIIGGTLAVAGGVGLAVVCKKANISIPKLPDNSQKVVEEIKVKSNNTRSSCLSYLKFNKGTIKEMWDENGYTNMLVEDLTIKELGEFGAEVVEKFDIHDDSSVSLLVGIGKNELVEVIDF